MTEPPSPLLSSPLLSSALVSNRFSSFADNTIVTTIAQQLFVPLSLEVILISLN
jgi:hypothetical protein